MVEALNLTKKYGKHTALSNVSFTLEKGKLYGLLGVNGAGKTTTLQLLSGYLAPTEGEVRIAGISMDKDPVLCKSKVGYLPEVPPLYPELTVSEFLSFQAELRGVPKREREEVVDMALRRGMLRRVKKRLIGQLSKGFRQRVGLASVMIGDPEVLLLDEPTNGLDPVQIVAMRDVLQELKKEKVLIVSSHVLSEVEQLADEYLILADGRLVYTGGKEGDAGKSLEEIFLSVTKEAYKAALLAEQEEEEEYEEEDDD